MEAHQVQPERFRSRDHLTRDLQIGLPVLVRNDASSCMDRFEAGVIFTNRPKHPRNDLDAGVLQLPTDRLPSRTAAMIVERQLNP